MERDTKRIKQKRRSSRSSHKDQYRLTIAAKHSSDNDIRMELGPHRQRFTI